MYIGVQFTWPCVAGSLRHPVYMLVPKGHSNGIADMAALLEL